ncbi:MAG: hypothetical protein K8R48_02355 [Alphaproteobacteria bacterium]|nr:hypothetical protein [Alphaproteobacteria bacterium]
MAYPDNQNYLYVIAGGETLKMLDKLKADADTAKQALEKMAQDWGAKISFDPHDSLFTFTGAVPAGWEKFPTRGGDMFNPDQSTKEGRKISSDINWTKQKMNILYQFSEACAEYCGTCRWNDYKYSFEQIGDKIVVKCPPATTDTYGSDGAVEHFIPPDSTPITFSEYAKMKEDAGLLKPATIKPFKKNFEF